MVVFQDWTDEKIDKELSELKECDYKCLNCNKKCILKKDDDEKELQMED